MQEKVNGKRRFEAVNRKSPMAVCLFLPWGIFYVCSVTEVVLFNAGIHIAFSVASAATA